ncbi:iron-sulfur cluster repair protein YtfE [Marinimicrobium sp. ARAG 43.8]|uniref:iron-sulfur cluster repair protein YtfE n=1 Tax=Marinimicrobium sp. ARAG 43.8 TaxID=3418719 RepID=UPI003CECE10C
MSMLERTLSELAREIPGATAVFHGYQLDFCCGGKQSLAKAAERKGADIDALVLALKESAARHTTSVEGWYQAPDADLIEHILTHYHDVHRQQLSELIRLSQRVELVHGGRPDCPAGLSDHLELMHAELEAHMRKEEQILFPMITLGVKGMARGPVAMMRHEHDDHGASVDRISELTQGINLPKGACNTWRALYLGLAVLETDLKEHIHLENNILFERIDSDQNHNLERGTNHG